MGPTKMLAFAGAATALIATAANAADFPAAPPPQMVRAPVAETTGWYLRGDIGMTNQRVDSLSYVPQDEAISRGLGDDSFESIHMDFDSSPFFGDIGGVPGFPIPLRERAQQRRACRRRTAESGSNRKIVLERYHDIIHT